MSQVFLRPFKLFVTYEREIRGEVVRLEKMHIPRDNKSKAEVPEIAKSEGQNLPLQSLTDTLHVTHESLSQDNSDNLERNKSPHIVEDAPLSGESKDMIPQKSKRCLEELRVLRELLDTDLKPMFDLRKQIKDGVARNIAFQDLWHLFSLGDEIVSNDSNGQNQVYRILNVCGGRPFLCNRALAGMPRIESTMDARDLPKFEILSYSYDSDGKDLGACQVIHTIKAYKGNKAITSLPCYPIIYLKNIHGLNPRGFFIQRGKHYMKLARATDTVHKRYDGMTVVTDDLREEVRQTLINK